MARDVSQERLAFDSGVDRSYLSGLERGEENPTIDVLERLAETLTVKLFELFEEPEPGTKPPPPLRPGRRAR